MKKIPGFIALSILMASAFAVPAFAGPGKHHGHRDGDKQEMLVDFFVRKMDQNGDRMISMDEHEAFSARMFYETDQNRDRMLSSTEIENQKMRDKKAFRDAMYENRQDGYNN